VFVGIFVLCGGVCKQRGYTRLAEIGDSGYSVKWDIRIKIRKHQSNKV